MKEQFIKNAQTAFLKDTIEFFNESNRCVVNGGCRYSPTAQSPGCAIGRHIPNEARRVEWDHCNIDGKQVDGSGLSTWKPENYIALGPLAVLGVGFLSDCQRLHDNEFNWTGSGLSPDGKELVKRFCKYFGLDESQVFAHNESSPLPAE